MVDAGRSIGAARTLATDVDAATARIATQAANLMRGFPMYERWKVCHLATG
jgi:hypothetical protein